MHAISQHFLITSYVLGSRLSIQNEYKRNLVHLPRDLLSTQAEVDKYISNAIKIFNKSAGVISVFSTRIRQLMTAGCNFSSWKVQHIWLLRSLALMYTFHADIPIYIKFKMI